MFIVSGYNVPIKHSVSNLKSLDWNLNQVAPKQFQTPVGLSIMILPKASSFYYKIVSHSEKLHTLQTNDQMSRTLG